ncbi:MAG: zinc ribbon domain-containing protein [Actinomycetota bacterium]|nr:zinc ribbon domain-containing protein [Actinomycetota bacterium]
MYCAECGKEIPEESEFCGYCGAVAAPAGGQAAAAASAATQGPPPGPPAPPPPDGPPPGGGAAPPMGTGVPPAQYGPASPRKSHLPWILGILGVLLVGGIVVVLLLGFAVGPKWFVGDDKASENPEETVEAFFKSWEKRDAEMLLGTMEPDFVKEIKAALGDDISTS